LNSKYYVYICEYESQETVFSRHFLTGISSCRKIAEITSEKLEEALSPERMHALLQQREITITDPLAVEKVLTTLNFTSEQVEAAVNKPYTYIRLVAKD